MLIRLLFWFLFLYFLLRFVIRVIIPVLIAGKNVGAKVRDFNGKADNVKSAAGSTTRHESSAANSKTSSAKGDYIDFEEIK